MDKVGVEVQGGNSQLSKVPEIILVLILHFVHPHSNIQCYYKVGPWLLSSQIKGEYHCTPGKRWNKSSRL